jgi:hypothetical protein
MNILFTYQENQILRKENAALKQQVLELQRKDRVFIPDPDLMRNVQRIAGEVNRALGSVVIEKAF